VFLALRRSGLPRSRPRDQPTEVLLA